MECLKKHKSEILLFFFFCLLFWTNYTPEKFLLGWDSLQTELNPTLGIRRAFFSVWQEYQSFGLVAGMGHAADLLRAILIWIFSFFLPQSAIRYAFHMLMVFSAGIGMLNLLKESGFNKERKPFALLGAFFYILNFAVIQMMFLPFESFSVFFAMLPWEIWAFLKVLEKYKSAKNWLIFIIVNILATPQAVSQQLFVVYILILGFLTLGILFKERSLNLLKSIIFAFVSIAIINSFWLLPQIYFLKTSSQVVWDAKINQLSTEEVFYSNQEKGNLKDFFAFNGFFYDRQNINHEPLFKSWKKHRESLLVQYIIYAITLISFLGLIQRTKYRISFIFIYLLAATFLLINTPPFGNLNQILRENALINQIFRSPFTKFSIPYALVASYFFTAGSYFIYTKINAGKNIIPLLFLGLILYQSFPAFGNYISQDMKLHLPEDYFKTIEYFKGIDKNKHIALLPEYTFWGWLHTKWSYDGSGFLWYGIEQPIVSRNFDMWSNQSESYFWEVKNALESENLELFEKVLEKYSIDYLIFDQSIIPVESSVKGAQFTKTNRLLEKSKIITLERDWNFISVYKINRKKEVKDFFSLTTQIPNIGPAIKITNDDNAFRNHGDYITNAEEEYQAYYPFLDLTTQTTARDKQWNLDEGYFNWYLSKKVPINLNQYEAVNKSGSIEVSLYKNKRPMTFNIPYETFIEKDRIIIQFPKILISLFSPSNTVVKDCNGKKGNITAEYNKKNLTVSSKEGGSACFVYDDQYLDQNYGYIIKLRNENVLGQRFFFYILDQTKEQPYTEDRLSKDWQYYILGPKFEHGTGYSFSFQNNSHTTSPSLNKLLELSVYLMPYDQIKQIMFVDKSLSIIPTSVTQGQTENQLEIIHINESLYVVNLELKTNNSKLTTKDQQPTTIILSQAYNKGWHAYSNQNYFAQILPFLFGQELTHLKVNNWQNGWALPNNEQSNDSQQIVIVYLPQYLQYFGFLMLGVYLLLLIQKPLLKRIVGLKKRHQR